MKLEPLSCASLSIELRGRMSQNESFHSSLWADRMQLAERELVSFVAAVTELFGPEQARLSAQDWLDELELMDSSTAFTRRDWRTVTIAASGRLATRHSVALDQRISISSDTS